MYFLQTWGAPLQISCRAAFTLLELIMGMVVVSLVAGALAAFTAAAGQNWQGAESPQSLPVTQTVISHRIQHIISNARSVGVISSGSLDTSSTQTAGVMLWLMDGMNVGGNVQFQDDKLELGELGWLEYDPSSLTIKLYRSIGTLSAIQSIRARISVSSAQFNTSTMPQNLKVSGATFLTSEMLATNVAAAKFSSRNPSDINGRPSVEFTIVLEQDGQKEVSYGNATLRNATTPQN